MSTITLPPRTKISHPTAAAVLDVRQLSVHHGKTQTLHEINFQLLPGQSVALVGGSGAGKSTVAKALAGLLTASTGTALLHRAEAHAPLELFSASKAQRRAAGASLHLLMQDPYASLPPHLPIARIVAEPLVIHRLAGGAQCTALVESALVSVGLDPARYSRRLPHELSGGERQRVAFARAVVTRPAIILADEPTGMLDATLRAGLCELMKRLSTEHGTAFLHITHDLALAAKSCDAVMVMHEGRIVEAGPTAGVLGDPQHPQTRRLVDAALRGARRVQLGERTALADR